MFNLSDYGYSPTDLDDVLFLSNIPIDILKENIQSQFDDPLEYRKRDYIQSFITKYEFSMENSFEDDLDDVKEYRDEFIKFMIGIFDEYLGVGFNELDRLSVDEQLETIHLTYRFFIKNIKKNFVNIVKNYIEENKNILEDDLVIKNDVTSNAFNSIIDDKFDILVLCNLSEIIEIVFEYLKTEADVDDFLKLCVKDEPILERNFVNNKYNKGILTGNFVENYTDMIYDTYFVTELQNKIRKSILKKYPLRKADIPKVEDSEEESMNEE